jgi:hypothetical protein
VIGDRRRCDDEVVSRKWTSALAGAGSVRAAEVDEDGLGRGDGEDAGADETADAVIGL